MRRMRRLKRIGLIASIALVVATLIPVTASAAWFTTTQLTNNGYIDASAHVSGNNVVWQGREGGNDLEIFFYNGSSTIQLTDNNNNDEDSQISGNNVVWEGDDGNDNEIFFYNGSSTTQLTNNGNDEYAPQVSGNNIVWEGFDGNDFEIFFYNGSSTVQLTNNGYDDKDAQVSGNNIVWEGKEGGNDWETFYYNGSSTAQLTNNGNNDINPQISGNNVVWEGYDGNDWEIFFYNGSSTTQLTNNGYDDNNSQISGNNVVWQGKEGGNDWETFFYNGSSTAQLTNNGYDDWYPQASGNNVVWRGKQGGNDWEIFFYNGSSTAQLTNNGNDDIGPQISGNNVVWSGNDGNDDEIFLAKSDTTKPSVSLWSPYVSTKHSKRPQFTVRWRGSDSQSGIDSYTLRVRRNDRRTWHTLKNNTTATSHLFKGKMGHTYNFRVMAKDKAGNTKWSRVKKTIVPYNEGANIVRRSGFNGYFKGSKSVYYLSSVRYSYKRGHIIAYKIQNAKSIGLITTKGPKRGKAKIFIDGKRLKTVDAYYKSKNRPRQLIYYKAFRKQKTHYIKIVNLGTPGRRRFDIDGIAVGR